MTEEGDHYYTVDEAARILQLSPACVRQMLRAGELEGERREERIEGVLGPWRIPKRPVHTLREREPDVLRAKRRELCETDTATVSLPSGEATSDTLSEALLRDIGMDTPSEASDLLSESVREIREKAEVLREELRVLEGRLEMMEITESALREGLQREKERAESERERADRLRDELEAERTRHRGEPRDSGGGYSDDERPGRSVYLWYNRGALSSTRILAI